MTAYLKSKISALVRALMAIYGESEQKSSGRFDNVLKFVFEQMDRMPWLPKCAIKMLTLQFGFSCFIHGLFLLHGRCSEDLCKKRLLAWSHSPLWLHRDFVKYYAAMVVLSLYSESKALDREGL